MQFGIDSNAKRRMNVPAAELSPGDDIVHATGVREHVIEPGVIWREALDSIEVCLRSSGKHQRCFSAYMHPDQKVDIDRPNLQLPGLEA
jgi:hypothetical protein